MYDIVWTMSINHLEFDRLNLRVHKGKVLKNRFFPALRNPIFQPQSTHVIDLSQPVAPTNLVNGAWNAPCRAQ